MKKRVAALVALVACGTGDLGPPSKVDTLRVLAVRADEPFALPGETVHLEALVADPGGNGRPIAFAWGSCLNPGSGEITDCAAAASAFAIGGPTFDLAVPSDALDGRPSGVPIGIDGVVFAACAGALYDARAETAPVTCVDGAGGTNREPSFLWGVKRVVVTSGARNANPHIAEVRLDGAPWSADATPGVASCAATSVGDCDDTHAIAIVAAPGSAETANGVTEDLVAFFFVSKGGVADDFARQGDSGTFATRMAATGSAAPGLATLWIVLRDDRGGVDWQVRRFSVR